MLEHVNFDEAKQSQLPFVEMLLNLGYSYIPKSEALRQRQGDTGNFILAEIAHQKLAEINGYEIDGVLHKFSDKDVAEAIDELEHLQYEGLIDTAQKVYNIIMPTSGGKTISITHGGKRSSQNFRFIDFKNPSNNAFHVTTEFTVTGKRDIRIDIVCFVNGIPFAAIENKKSSVSVQEAINQLNRNQGPEYCPKFFAFTQLLVAANSKSMLYGTTGTGSKFYASWKEKDVPLDDVEAKALQVMGRVIPQTVYEQVIQDLNGDTRNCLQHTARLVTAQDQGVVALFEPTRLLDLTKNYILFEAGTKKPARYQQYFAIHKMLSRVQDTETIEGGITRRKGGLVWHTQGSGKSLTMVMFVKALIENPHISNPRVIIVTDRKDLDRQIRDTFKNCNLKKEVVQATSGQHLLDLIKAKDLSVVTTLVHKFETARKKGVRFTDSDQNIFVLIDEAHRTQSGVANFEMTRIIPNACYIGFTGTPLMRDEKESWRKFGGYIDKYTIDDALADEIILPLIYEGRYVEMVQNSEQVDKHFARITEHASAEDKKELQKFIDKGVIKDNPQRILEIAYDIQKHYTQYFQNTGLKAQIVAPSKYSAVIFQNFFEQEAKIRTAVVISDEHEDGNEANIHKKAVAQYLDTVRDNHLSVGKYERDVIESFKHNEEGIEIIIVVDKLLTGFDAPCDTVLYLAKDLRDHNLLQAIARVNRLFDNAKIPKTAGYIMDYSENAKNIKSAMQLFGNYDEEDMRDTLIDVDEKINELETSYETLTSLFKQISGSGDDEAYIQFLGDEPTRELFYKSVSEFIRNLNECYVFQDFAHKFKQFDLYTRELKKFLELRKTANLVYADRTQLNEYKHSLISILDKYVDARGVELLTQPINITDAKQFDEAIEQLGSDHSKAEAIAAQMDKTITEKLATDPEFYERFSLKIHKVLEEMRSGKLADVQALEQLKLFRDEVVGKKEADLPAQISGLQGASIFYRNLQDDFAQYQLAEEQYLKIVVDIYSTIKKSAIVDWYKNLDVKRQMRNAVDDYLYEEVVKGLGVEITTEAARQIIDNALALAENNYEIFT